MPHEEIPFWLVNVPRDQWPAKCPDFLLNVSEKDRRSIGTWDSDFRRLSWPQVKDFLRANRFDQFQRLPSDLRKYRQHTANIMKEHGSIVNFVLMERLHWPNVTPKGPPFSNLGDINILYNDFPYGIDEKIVHLVVWTKFDLEDDPATGELTPKARREIDDYVQKTFCSRTTPENVIWFKNWRSLRSIHAVEHFHVMLYEPDMAFVEEITNGDVPLAAKAACRTFGFGDRCF